MQACNFVNKYVVSKSTTKVVPYDKIKATQKWVEYALDIKDMQALMMSTRDFKLKWQLMDSLEVAERKKAYMYKHKNFELNLALKLFDLVKNLPKTTV